MPKTQTAPEQGQLFEMTPEREQEAQESFEAAGKRREKFNTNLTRAVAILIGRTKKTPSGRNLTRHDMAVLYCDLLTMGGPDGWCYRTDGQLAEELGSHPSTVNKSRRKLRECGFIAVAKRVRGRGNRIVMGPMLSLVADLAKASEASTSGQGRQSSSGHVGPMSSGQGRQSVRGNIKRNTSRETLSEETRANESESSPTQTLNENEDHEPDRFDDYSDWANNEPFATSTQPGTCNVPDCDHDTEQDDNGKYFPRCKCCQFGDGCHIVPQHTYNTGVPRTLPPDTPGEYPCHTCGQLTAQVPGGNCPPCLELVQQQTGIKTTKTTQPQPKHIKTTESTETTDQPTTFASKEALVAHLIETHGKERFEALIQ